MAVRQESFIMSSLSNPVDAPVIDWKRYRASAIRLFVRFASTPQSIETLEGAVQCAADDAIVTGLKGETWPVPRLRFRETYVPVPPTAMGQVGFYSKKPREVLAGQLYKSHAVILSHNRGVLHGQPGDVLVEYAEGDRSIVAADIFERTYQSVED